MESCFRNILIHYPLDERQNCEFLAWFETCFYTFPDHFPTCFPPLLLHYASILPREQQRVRSTAVTGGRAAVGKVVSLNRCPFQKVMVWDNYLSASTRPPKMGDSAVVTFQCETLVIRIWISFHSHSGSHPNNTCLAKSTRWNWPVSSVSRAICAARPWITAMVEGGGAIVTLVDKRAWKSDGVRPWFGKWNDTHYKYVDIIYHNVIWGGRQKYARAVRHSGFWFMNKFLPELQQQRAHVPFLGFIQRDAEERYYNPAELLCRHRGVTRGGLWARFLVHSC